MPSHQVGNTHFLASPPTLPAGPGTFDAVLLVAVPTCVIEDQGQQALVKEVIGALKPGGLLYVCDFLVPDTRHARTGPPRMSDASSGGPETGVRASNPVDGWLGRIPFWC